MTSLLSVVSPLRDEAPNVEALVERLRMTLEPAGITYEIVLVDDGSKDETWRKIAALGRNAPVRGVRLSRSFGQQAAILAGLAAADGELLVVMDADLQDPPDLLPEMVAEQKRHGAALVLARRNSQKDVPWFKRVTSRMFSALLGRIAEHPIHRNVGDFYLMRWDGSARRRARSLTTAAAERPARRSTTWPGCEGSRGTGSRARAWRRCGSRT
jgi:glycosyltransferase involved in cell wall biosynthesis